MAEKIETRAPFPWWGKAGEVIFWPFALVSAISLVLDWIVGVDGLDDGVWFVVRVVSLIGFVVGGLIVAVAFLRGQRPGRHAKADDESLALPRWGYNAGLIWEGGLYGLLAVRQLEALGLDHDGWIVIPVLFYPAWITATVVWFVAFIINGRREKVERVARERLGGVASP